APGLEFEQAVYMHGTSQFNFHMPNERKPRTQTCFLVKDRVFLVNHHTWMMPFEQFEVRGQTFHKKDCTFVHLVYDSISTDLVAVQLPKGPCFRNNIPKFISASDIFPMRNTPVTGINADGPLFYSGSVMRPPAVQEISTGPTAKFMLYKAQTMPGFCGSPIVASVAGAKKIIGIHSAGAHGVAGAVTVTKENLSAIMDYFSQTSAMTPE
nr:3C [mischivirus C1]